MPKICREITQEINRFVFWDSNLQITVQIEIAVKQAVVLPSPSFPVSQDESTNLHDRGCGGVGSCC